MIDQEIDLLTGPHCPCCGAGAGALKLLAELLDTMDKKSGNPNNGAQKDLRKWAGKILMDNYTPRSVS